MRWFYPKIAALVWATLVSFAGGVQAAPVFTQSGVFSIYEGEHSFPHGLYEKDIFLHKGKDVTATTGDVGTKHGNPPEVTFSSDGTFDAADGEGTIKPDSKIFDLTITAPDGYSFTDLTFSFLGSDQGKPGNPFHRPPILPIPPNNDLTISVFNGLDLLGSDTFTHLGKGLIDFLVLALDDTTFTRITLASTTFKQIKEFEISGLELIPDPPSSAPLTAVPLPPAFLLFGAGLGLMGWLRKRSKRQAEFGRFSAT